MTTSGEKSDQFHRTRLILGSDGLSRLQNSQVMIVGLGAVGSYVVEALSRAGIGRFRLVDFDKAQLSNINRQLLATHATLGRPKAELARERILAINPSAQVETRQILVNRETVATLFEDDWSDPADYVVDAIDTLGPKVALIEETLRRGAPLVSSMGAALRVDADLVRFGKLTGVSNCPLAAQLRKRLRRVGVNTDDVDCVYSPEPIRDALRAGDERIERVAEPEPLRSPDERSPQGRPRNTLGSLSTIVGIFGLRLAGLIIEDLY